MGEFMDNYGEFLKEEAVRIILSTVAIACLWHYGSTAEAEDEIRKAEETKKRRSELFTKVMNEVKGENPSASLTKGRLNGTKIETYAERKTDSAKIKSIKEKYLFQLTRFEQAKQKLQEMKQNMNENLLKTAEKGDYLGVVKSLENGADVNYQDAQTGNTAFILALDKCPSVGKGIKIAEYLISEPDFNMEISNKDGLSQEKLLQDKQAETRMQIEASHDNQKRNRGNSEIDKLAKQVENLYKELDSTYGKEMRDALGYEYKEEQSTDKIYVNKVVEIIYNEDNTKDTINVERIGVTKEYHGGTARTGSRRRRSGGVHTERYIISHKFPTQKAKLKLSLDPKQDSR